MVVLAGEFVAEQSSSIEIRRIVTGFVRCMDVTFILVLQFQRRSERDSLRLLFTTSLTFQDHGRGD